MHKSNAGALLLAHVLAGCTVVPAGSTVQACALLDIAAREVDLSPAWYTRAGQVLHVCGVPDALAQAELAACAAQACNGYPSPMMAQFKAYAWQLLALVLAALLLWQSIGHLLALRVADKARVDLVSERAAAAAAAAEISERYRKLEGTYRENLDTITRESGQAQARAAADRLRGDLADYITAHRAAANARAAAA